MPRLLTLFYGQRLNFGDLFIVSYSWLWHFDWVEIQLLCDEIKAKSKIPKILNSEENSKRKVPNKMAKSNDKTHQTNGQQLSYSWLGTDIFKCRKRWIEPCFIALILSLVWQSHQIPLYLQRYVNKTDIKVNIVIVCVKQSSLCHNLKTKKYLTKKHKKHLSNLTTHALLT